MMKNAVQRKLRGRENENQEKLTAMGIDLFSE